MRDQSEGQESDGAGRRDDLADRLAKLNARIDSGKAAQKAQSEREQGRANRGDKAGFALAFRLSSEFIAAIIVGAVIGFAVDRFFDSAPWAMIVFLLLGFAAGILNVLRAAGMVAPSELNLKNLQEAEKDREKNR